MTSPNTERSQVPDRTQALVQAAAALTAAHAQAVSQDRSDGPDAARALTDVATGWLQLAVELRPPQ